METAKSLIQGKMLVYVAPYMTVSEATGIMAKAKTGAVVVLNDGNLCGIFTERDLLNRVVVARRDPKTTKIRDVLTSNVIVAYAHETYQECLEKMKKFNCRNLPVVENELLIGMISIQDLLMHDIAVKDEEIKMINYLYHYSPPDVKSR